MKKKEKGIYGLMTKLTGVSKFFAALSAGSAVAGLFCAIGLDIWARKEARERYKEEMSNKDDEE